MHFWSWGPSCDESQTFTSIMPSRSHVTQRTLIPSGPEEASCNPSQTFSSRCRSCGAHTFSKPWDVHRELRSKGFTIEVHYMDYVFPTNFCCFSNHLKVLPCFFNLPWGASTFSFYPLWSAFTFFQAPGINSYFFLHLKVLPLFFILPGLSNMLFPTIFGCSHGFLSLEWPSRAQEQRSHHISP